MRCEVDRKGRLDGRDGNVSLDGTVTVGWLELLQRHVTAGPFDGTGQLLERRHIGNAMAPWVSM